MLWLTHFINLSPLILPLSGLINTGFKYRELFRQQKLKTDVILKHLDAHKIEPKQ